MKEQGQNGAPRALDDLELAVRLSYFLWSSPPDSQLLELAKKKQLRDPVVLRAQVDRLIQDRRAHNFVSGLAHQWLDMKRLDFFQFDVARHREFDESTRAAAREEVYQSILHLLRAKDQGQLQYLLNSDYVVVNGLMAAHYGLDGVVGDHYRKVSLPENSPRGGFLGMAAIHAMGSDGRESSPVERGSWVLRHIMHSPPPRHRQMYRSFRASATSPSPSGKNSRLTWRKPSAPAAIARSIPSVLAWKTSTPPANGAEGNINTPRTEKAKWCPVKKHSHRCCRRIPQRTGLWQFLRTTEIDRQMAKGRLRARLHRSADRVRTRSPLWLHR